MSLFDWHGGRITRVTPVTGSYRNTQNVRRFFQSECGGDFKFDRAAQEWLRRNAVKRQGVDAATPAAGLTKPKRLGAE